MAMISEAAVMMNPVSRAGPFSRPPIPPAIFLQRPVVHVHAPRPQDLLRVDPQVVAEVQVRVEQRRQQVVGRGDGVEVAVEVQVDLVHRVERGFAAAGGAALLPEDRSERRLAQGRDGMLADRDQSLREADGVHRLAFAAGRRRDGGDEDELSAAGGKAIERLEADLGGVSAVGFEQIVRQTEAGSDFRDGLHSDGEMIPRRRAPADGRRLASKRR